MREIWKDIPDYEGKYQVSNKGRVKNINFRGTGREVLFTPWKTRCGYLMVSLRKNDKKTGYSVHTLVYRSFKGQIPEGMQVNHINEDKTDNRLENLNLMTCKENNNWGTRNERIGKKVIQYDLNGNLVDIFKTAQDAQNKLNIWGTSIGACCRNKIKTTGGYKWKYLNDVHPFILRLQKDLYYLHPLS